VSFPGSKFKGEIVPAIKRLVDDRIVRILDLVFIQKSEDGDVVVVELSDLGGGEASAFDALDGEVDELLTDDDIEGLSDLVAPGDAAAMLVWENAWAAEAAAAIRAADGEVVLHERIPSDQVEASWASAAASVSECWEDADVGEARRRTTGSTELGGNRGPHRCHRGYRPPRWSAA
jgi:hypothetical protein